MRACASHCRVCGQHFLTDDAFDAHRRFAEGDEGDWDCRICIEAEDDSAFELVDADGVCEIAGPAVQLHVNIWRRAGNTGWSPTAQSFVADAEQAA